MRLVLLRQPMTERGLAVSRACTKVARLTARCPHCPPLYAQRRNLAGCSRKGSRADPLPSERTQIGVCSASIHGSARPAGVVRDGANALLIEVSASEGFADQVSTRDSVEGADEEQSNIGNRHTPIKYGRSLLTMG